MTAAGYDSMAVVAEWAARAGDEVLSRLGAPFDPFTGRFRAPDERTLREAFARVDPQVSRRGSGFCVP